MAMTTSITTMRSSLLLSISNSYQIFTFVRGRKSSGFFSTGKDLPSDPCICIRAGIVAFASRKSEKKGRNNGKTSKSIIPLGKNNPLKDSEDSSGDVLAGGGGSDTDSFSANASETSPITSASRGAVLQSCISTSVFLLAFGALVRQASHVASMEGWTTFDASAEVSFNFETWHIELIIGLVILITSSRYVLLRTWRDFAESSDAANQQVLGLLQPLDYAIVAFLPGISEELLFRGALLPLFGLTWESALVVGSVFGYLHLGGGRRYSFAIWATFVGFAYGLATVVSSSVIVPIVSHSLNNLIGGILWHYEFTQKKN
ncbi:uncharacterized protein M6B38_391190 [Iris pallida]|uniref:CAAX prenyl protease 2/Lysostaphin resistance protein A-like domain-containing protein n=1 Tax=Iris pallida TaxID=29817 RepID=A0AAX6FYY4_IRIPA|nr:uncharacterized protein M6B38_391190 [Iris pallida]